MMTPERWARIKEIFAVVAETPRESRTSILAELCRSEQDLQAEIEKLLAQHDEMGGFLEGSPAPAAEKASLLQAGTIIAERYQIVALLGRGGMGEVYEAEDRELGERVALKVLHHESALQQDVMDRLRREVQLARRVTHPNVCRVFDLGYHRQAGQPITFLSMELIKGETLTERLKREGKIAFPEALHIARQLCQALGAAHEAGILHRDFKCGNVMLLETGAQVRAVVTDFGIARWIQPPRDETKSFATNTGLVVGTPAYMSPEQLMGEKLTAASDIYSLGLVLYEMVTGVRPFRGESSWTETLKRLSADAAAPITMVPDLDPRWNRTIMRCLQRSPAARFASAREVLDSLQRRTRYSLSDVRPWLLATACVALALGLGGVVLRDRLWPPSLPAQKHIAVIPFTLKGGSAADQATAYGLAESLTQNLGRLQVTESSLWVVPWKEVRNQKPDNIARAASALGANLLITGQMEKSEGKLQLRAAVKDAHTLRNLRAEVIEIPETGMLRLEDTLLERVSAMLQLPVPAGMLRHLPVDETVEPGAYEFYEQGKGYLLHYSAEDVDRAIVLLQKATEKDSKFALAYANLAFAYAWKYRVTRDPRLLEQARSLAGRALALNDRLAPAHLALALAQKVTGDLDSAVRELELALQLDPTDAETLNLLALTYDESGRLLQAEALLKDALKRYPGSWVNYNSLGYFYYRHGQFTQAEPLFRTAIELAPDNPISYDNLGGVYLALGKYKEADSLLTRAIAIKPDANGYSNLGTARFYLGRYSDAAAMFQKAAELRPADHRLWRNLGDAYTLAGDRARAAQAYETARQELEKEVASRPENGQALTVLALYHAKLGQQEKALQKLAQAGRIAERDGAFFFNAAMVYELAGQREQAIGSLGQAIRKGYPLAEIRDAHELDQLRKDSRYASLAGGPEAAK